MKYKATTKSDRWLTHSQILTTVGAVGLLCPILLTARGDTTTTETSRSPAAESSASETIAAGFTATPEILLPASELETAVPNANVPLQPLADSMLETLPANTNVSTDTPTGFAMIGILSDSSPLPAIADAVPVFGPGALGLAAPDEQSVNKPLPWAEVSLGWGQLLLQFFAPCSCPAPPGGSRQPDRDESDRPWPVISASAATGTSWNEPSAYQAQGFLSFCW